MASSTHFIGPSTSTAGTFSTNPTLGFEPTVYYHCPCKKTKAPLYQLYFCPLCCCLCCHRCMRVRPIQYYCPSCLFDVPSTSLRPDKNSCTRNCFECPVCQATLLVLAHPEQGHVLQCVACRWDSREIAMTFDRPTGLGALVLKEEEALPCAQAFQQVKAYWAQKKETRMDSHARGAPHHFPVDCCGTHAMAMGRRHVGVTRAQNATCQMREKMRTVRHPFGPTGPQDPIDPDAHAAQRLHASPSSRNPNSAVPTPYTNFVHTVPFLCLCNRHGHSPTRLALAIRINAKRPLGLHVRDVG